MSDDDYIRFFKPSIGEDEINEVVDCLKSGWLTTAKRAKQFEADFAQYMGFKHAVALNSCTAALHLALEAVGLKEGELVLVPTMTFAATAEVVRYFNAIPVLVDCNEDDFCMDMDHAEDILKKLGNGEKIKGVPEDHGKVKGIMPVHYGGQVADVLKCRALCDKYGLFMVEDCAHTCPAYYKDKDGNWQMVGATADIACFSFYANKTITTGEGGMATTNNHEWADRMRVMSLHGISKDAWKRFERSGSWYYEIVAPGFKYNMPDTAAAIGVHQLKKADSFWNERKKVAELFSEKLAGVEGVIIPSEKENRKHSWHLYIIRVDSPPSGINRDDFIKKLGENGVGSSVHYMPLHMHPYYKEKLGVEPEDFPVAQKLFNQIVSLPIYPGLTDAEIDKICDTVKLMVASKNMFLSY
jgi:perosamine synthetase